MLVLRRYLRLRHLMAALVGSHAEYRTETPSIPLSRPESYKYSHSEITCGA